MSKALVVTEENFEAEVLNSDVPVLVDFWATWCGPCLAMAPVVDAVADKFQGKAKVVKIDVDENRAIAGQFGVRSIPTFAVFKGGEVVNKMIGGMPIQKLEEALKGAGIEA
ncbi:MAG: thioredoxin [Flammeovirgaceae bacterium]